MLNYLYRIDKIPIGSRKVTLYRQKHFVNRKKFVVRSREIRDLADSDEKSQLLYSSTFSIPTVQNVNFSHHDHSMDTSSLHFVDGANVAQMYNKI